MQVNVTHPSQLNEPGPRSEGSLMVRTKEASVHRCKRIDGQCNGTWLVDVTRGALQWAPALNFNQPFEEDHHVAYL